MSAFDWDDLRFFLAVARAGRLTAAARQLEADHTTVSRRISALEAALKAKLFERQPQGYTLTEQGERLLANAESMETQALAVASELGGADLALSGTVRIGAPDGIGTYFLAPELGALAERHPGLDTAARGPAAHLLAVEARGRHRRHPGAADGRAPRVAQAHRLPAQALRLEGLSQAARPGERAVGPAGKTLVTYVADLLYSPVLDYFSGLEKHTARRFECASVVAQAEAVRAGVGIGILHDYAVRQFPELQVVLPEVSYLRTYWLVTHADVRVLAPGGGGLFLHPEPGAGQQGAFCVMLCPSRGLLKGLSQTSKKTTEIPMPSKLDQLRAMTVVVADTGDIDAVRRLKPQDCTTNPTLLLKAAEIRPMRHRRGGPGLGPRGRAAPARASWRRSATGSRSPSAPSSPASCPGRVSTEVDADLSFDTQATVDKARAIIEAYEERGVGRERILIKIASTWEGIRAAEMLQKEGIDCNLTLLFSLAQAHACAEAGVFLISPFVGRILDWHVKAGGGPYTGETDPGVLSVRSIYASYKAHGVKTVVMGASFRNIGEIEALAGCDRLTISPALLDELAARPRASCRASCRRTTSKGCRPRCRRSTKRASASR